MRELDEMLVRYLDECYPQDSDADKACLLYTSDAADDLLQVYIEVGAGG